MNDIVPSRTRPASLRGALALSAMLGTMGVAHFRSPAFFDAIVPPALPGSARTYTYVSGGAELAVAAALAVPRTRATGGRLAALLFLAIFPANVQMAVDVVTDPKSSRWTKVHAVARLPLQIPLVGLALSVSRRYR